LTLSGNPEPGKTPRLRLHRCDKLRTKTQFEQVRRDGSRAAGAGMVAVVAPAPDGKLGCGVICSRKYSTLSVKRNRARRLLWESFRLLKPELLPCRIVIIPRRKMMNYNRMQATAELASLLIERKALAPRDAALPQEH